MKLVLNLVLTELETKVDLIVYDNFIKLVRSIIPIESVKVIITTSSKLEVIVIQGENQSEMETSINENVYNSSSMCNNDPLLVVSFEGRDGLSYRQTADLVEKKAKCAIMGLKNGEDNQLVSLLVERGYVSRPNIGCKQKLFDILKQLKIKREYYLHTFLRFGSSIIKRDRLRLATFQTFKRRNTPPISKLYVMKTPDTIKGVDHVTDWKNKNVLFQRTYMGYVMLTLLYILSLCRLAIPLVWVYKLGDMGGLSMFFKIKYYKIILSGCLLFRLVLDKWLISEYTFPYVVFGYLMSVVIQMIDPFFLGEHGIMWLIKY